MWVTVGAATFYGASVVAAYANENYQVFFTEKVPGGRELMQQLDPKTLGRQYHKMHLDDKVSAAADAVRQNFDRLTSSLRENKQMQHTREEVERHAADLQHRLASQLSDLKSMAAEEGHVLENQLHHLRENSSQWLEQGIELVEKAAHDVRSRTKDVVHDVNELGHKALAPSHGSDGAHKFDETLRAPAGTNNSRMANGESVPVEHEAPAASGGPKKPPFGGKVPVEHEAPTDSYSGGERKLHAEPDPNAVLRTDPGAPKLPQMSLVLSKLTGSEPVVKQLANTIDELSQFVRETPSGGAVARGVLESAQADLQQLCSRLDQIKKTDAKKLDMQLASQARDFEKELERSSKQAAAELSKREKDWDKKFDEIQRKQVSEFKGRLAKELETQSAIINQRLHEEVIAQGVELQRKWAKEIKSKVEHERAGRLARLDELASELHHLEEVSLVNSKSLDENIHIHTLTAALRSLRGTIDAGDASADAAEPNAYVRRTFEKQLLTLRNTPLAQQDPLIAAALDVLKQSGAAKTGVESVPTLAEWFSTGLAPRLRRVALLPEQGAGFLSYVFSATLSPLLASTRGLVPGDDTASTIARAEWYLDHQDLNSAAREINQLKGWGKVLASDWLDAARKRLTVDQALELVDKETAFSAILKT